VPFHRITPHDDLSGEVIFFDHLGKPGLDDVDCFTFHFLGLINKSKRNFISPQPVEFWVSRSFLKWREKYLGAIPKGELFALHVD